MPSMAFSPSYLFYYFNMLTESKPFSYKSPHKKKKTLKELVNKGYIGGPIDLKKVQNYD